MPNLNFIIFIFGLAKIVTSQCPLSQSYNTYDNYNFNAAFYNPNRNETYLTSLVSCLAACSRAEHCKSVLYYPSNQTCEFYLSRPIMNSTQTYAYQGSSVYVKNICPAETLMIMKSHTGNVRVTILLNDGNIATGGFDALIKIWNPYTGELIRTLSGHTNTIFYPYSITQLRNGNLVSGALDSKIILWNITTGSMIKTLLNHTYYVAVLKELSSGYLASGSNDTRINIWDLNSGQVIRTLTGHNLGVTSLLELADGTLISGSADATINFWNPNNGALIRTLNPGDDGVSDMKFLLNGNLITGTMNGIVKIWSLDTYQELYSFSKFGFSTLAVHRDGTVSFSNWNARLEVYSTNGWKSLRFINTPTHCYGHVELNDGNLAAGCTDNNVYVWKY